MKPPHTPTPNPRPRARSARNRQNGIAGEGNRTAKGCPSASPKVSRPRRRKPGSHDVPITSQAGQQAGGQGQGGGGGPGPPGGGPATGEIRGNVGRGPVVSPTLAPRA